MAKKKSKKRGCSKGNVRDSSGDCRNYKKETEYHARPEQRKNRSNRNKARRKMGLKKGDPREVDHKKPLSEGGSNEKQNLRVTSRSYNRKRRQK